MHVLDNVIYKGNTGGSTIIPDSRIETNPAPAVYPCRYCEEKFLTEEDRGQHHITAHPVRRPSILFKGRQVRREEFAIRHRLTDHDIEIIDADRVIVDDTVELSPPELKVLILEKHSGVLNIRLFHRNYQVNYRVRFQIHDDAELDKTEEQFYEIFNSGLTLASAFEHFNEKIGKSSTVRSYASALGCYITAVMTKDRLPEAWLPFENYVAKLGEACDGLEEYNRPLAQILISIMRFMMNDFDVAHADRYLPKLGIAKRFYIDGQSTQLSYSDADTRSVPVDHNTELIINYCCASKRQRRPLVEPISDMYKTSLTDAKDKAKAAFIMWSWYRGGEEAREYKKHLRYSSYFGTLIENIESS